jgi:hypothetical protein
MIDRQIVIALSGLLGLLVPAAVVFMHRLSAVQWWPSWVRYLWPSSRLLGVQSGNPTLGGYATIALCSVLNALLYALVAWVLVRLIAGPRR